MLPIHAHHQKKKKPNQQQNPTTNQPKKQQPKPPQLWLTEMTKYNHYLFVKHELFEQYTLCLNPVPYSSCTGESVTTSDSGVIDSG